MNKYQKFGKLAEKIVHDILESKGKKVISRHDTGPNTFGDFEVDGKIIEVKGFWTDEDSESDEDFPSSQIQLSAKEWELLEKNPKKFELWIVYRLDRKHSTNKGWPTKYTIIPGPLLLKFKKIDRVILKTPKAMWAESIPEEIPLKIKKSYKLDLNE